MSFEVGSIIRNEMQQSPSDECCPRLPSILSSGGKRLPRHALRYWRMVAASVFSVLIISIWIIWMVWLQQYISFGVVSAITAALTAVGLLDVVCLSLWRWRHYSYTVSPQWVYITEGRFLRRTLTIPVTKIISVKLIRGPLLKGNHLTKLILTSLLTVESVGPVDEVEALKIHDDIISTHIISETTE